MSPLFTAFVNRPKERSQTTTIKQLTTQHVSIKYLENIIDKFVNVDCYDVCKSTNIKSNMKNKLYK